jgi:hypothetical protein
MFAQMQRYAVIMGWKMFAYKLDSCAEKGLLERFKKPKMWQAGMR